MSPESSSTRPSSRAGGGDVLALRPTEAARLCGISRAEFYRLLDTGEIPSRRHGRKRLVLMRELRAWLESLAEA